MEFIRENVSTFKSFAWKNVHVSCSPKGKRGLPLARNLPYLTGEDFLLRLEIRVDGLPPVETMYLSVRRGDRQDFSNIDPLIIEMPKDGTKKTTVNLGPLPYSDEYLVDAHFNNQVKRIAIVQVVQNWKVIFFPIAFAFGIASAVVTQCILQWVAGK